jgi:C4-type Zn-finger protein
MAGPRRKEPIKPTTLGSARQSVQATLAVSCPKCQHEAFIKVAQWPHGMPVALFGSIMECSKCGSMGADVRLVRKERRG